MTIPGERARPVTTVIFNGAERAVPAILDTLARRFDLHEVHRVSWSPARFDENLARLLGRRPAISHRRRLADAVGRGPVTVAIASDRQPARHAERAAAVNGNAIDVSDELRRASPRPEQVHVSLDPRRAERDAMLLLGRAPAPARRGASWDGTVRPIARDLAGAAGWQSMGELLPVMNRTCRYVVLRNFEGLPAVHQLGHHADIDVLTDDYHEMIRILNARPLYGVVPPWGGRFAVRIGDGDVIFDLRHVTDGYYAQEWSRRILDRRVLLESGAYVPQEDDYLETLAYHAILQKRTVAPDYRDRLAAMASRLGRAGWDSSDLDDDRLRTLVQDITARRGYRIVRPRDPMVFFHYANAGWRFPQARRKAAGLRRELMIKTFKTMAAAAGLGARAQASGGRIRRRNARQRRP